MELIVLVLLLIGLGILAFGVGHDSREGIHGRE
jgi:hypothetical protein